MKFEKRLALTGYLRKTFGVSDIHDKASIRRYYKRFNEDATGAAYDASGISKVCNVLRAISRVSVSEEKLLEYDRNIRSHWRRSTNTGCRKTRSSSSTFSSWPDFIPSIISTMLQRTSNLYWMIQMLLLKIRKRITAQRLPMRILKNRI